MNILYIVPPYQYQRDDLKKRITFSKNIPYGVLCLASYLKEYSTKPVEVKIIDFSVIDNSISEMIDEIRETVQSFKPDIVGMSALFNSVWYYIKPFLDVVKEVDKKIVTLVGGSVATHLYRELLGEINSLDGACYAEGEIPMLNLIMADDFYELMDKHPSFITRNSLKAAQVPQATYVIDLDTLPLVDFSLINLELYGGRKYELNNTVRNLPLHTSRGCPFSCVFCSAGSMSGKKYRTMSFKRVIEHVEDMINNHAMEHLNIEDSQFLLDIERAKGILKALIPYNLKISAASGFSVRFIDDEMAYLLKQSGFETVSLAIESGSDRVLKEVIKKPATKEEALNAINLCRKYNLYIIGFFVIGIPGETEEDLNETVEFIVNTEIDQSYINVAMPLHGSRLYDICIENKYIEDNILLGDDFNFFNPVINTPEFTADYISNRAYLINLDVNFIRNYNLRLGNWKKSIQWFKTVTDKYPFHAIAYYCLAKSYDGIGQEVLADKYMNKYRALIAENNEWYEFAKYFNLPLL